MKRSDRYHIVNIKYLIGAIYWFKQKKWKLKNISNKETVKKLPLWSRLEIELQSNCNRDCYFCPRYGDSSGVRKDSNGKHIKKSMSTWKIFEVIDEAEKLGFQGSIGFHGLSEPFLDNRFVEVATYAKDKGMIVCESTNGDILKKDPELCSEIDGLVSHIHIGLYDYKSKKERNAQIRFWENRFKETNVWFSLAAEFPRMRQNTRIYDKKLLNSKIRNYPCFATQGLHIRYDGEVMLCCQDDYCSFKLGNVFNSLVEDIWWSEKHIKIVESLKVPGGRMSYKLCSNCMIKAL